MSVLQNKRLPYWNSSAGFDFDHITVIRMIICTKVPNFIHIGPSNAEIWRHVDFSIWRPRRLNTTSGFLLVDHTVFGSSKYINKPNYRRHISFHGWDITTSDLKKNKRPPYWNSTSDFDFRYITGIGMLFCIRLTNFIEMRPLTAARPELGSAVLKICVINRHRTLFTWVDCPACQFSLSTERARRSFVRRKNECLNYT